MRVILVEAACLGDVVCTNEELEDGSVPRERRPGEIAAVPIERWGTKAVGPLVTPLVTTCVSGTVFR